MSLATARPMKLLRLFTVSTILLLSLVGVAQTQAADDPLPLHLLDVTGSGQPGTLDKVLPEGPVIVHFWATWCGPCKEELPQVHRFARLLKEKGGGNRLFLVSVDKIAHDRVVGFLRDVLELPDLDTLQASPVTVPLIFPVRGYPSTFMLDGERRIVRKQDGPIAWSRPNIQRLLFGHMGIED